MRQIIRFDKNTQKNVLKVLESSEVDPGVVMPLHEEEFVLEEVTTASKEGLDAFRGAIRRRSFFPTASMCEKLYQQVAPFFASDETDTITVEYDDVDFFPQKEEFQLESEDVELDKILEKDGTSEEDEMREIDSEDDTPRFKPEDTSEHEN